MLKHVFSIFFRPQRTLDRLLEERNHGQSWGATFLLIGLHALLLFLFGIFFSRSLTDAFELMPGGFASTDAEIMSWVMIGVFVVTILATAVFILLSRFFFAWFVQLGLWIVASRQMRETENRGEKARLLRLVQPYTLWIMMFPTLLLSLLVPLFFDMGAFFEAVMMSEMEGTDELPDEMLPAMIGMLVWSGVSNLVSFGMYIYQVIVRVIAIRKIYDNVSVAQAFFGPFIIYALLFFVLIAVYVAFLFLMMAIGTSVDTFDPELASAALTFLNV